MFKTFLGMASEETIRPRPWIPLPPDLIEELTPKIRGWLINQRHVVDNTHTCARRDYEIFSLCSCGQLGPETRGHRNTNLRLAQGKKYFERPRVQELVFRFGEKYEQPKGNRTKCGLLSASDTPIQRQCQGQCESNPYDHCL